MNFRLIRWQLPISYAGIALLAVLSLGLVLVATLRSYYTERERLYLFENGQLVRGALAPLLASGLPASAVQAQVENLSSLVGARVRLLDSSQNVVADSGSPAGGDIFTLSPLVFKAPVQAELFGPGVPANRLAIPAEPFPPGEAPSNGLFLKGLSLQPSVRAVYVYGGPDATEIITGTAPTDGTFSLITRFPSGRVLSMLDGGGAQGSSLFRSPAAVTLSVQDASGQLFGQIQLTEGPAFGGAILSSVVRALGVAGVIAVLLAAGMGWLASRRVTAPLTALAEVTRRMASGDLSARAREGERDEFGALARSFNQMAAQVEETVLTLRNFASDAAHELQTPLTALVTNLELALGETERPRQADFLDQAQGQVQRLSALAQDLLDLSRIESGAGAADFAPVDLAALVREASETYAAQAEQKNQSFTLQVLPDTLTVRGNENQLRRAVSNLLENAVKFTPAGGSITVRLDQEGGEARLRVDDSGTGIPEEDLELLFSRFHRGRNAAAYPGSGLGLAIVRAVAKSQRGRVKAENLPDGGARFTLSIPAVEPA